MPTNRPFFFNFLAAFRAPSAIPKSTSTTASTPTTTPSTTPYSPPTLSRAIATTKSPSAGATTAAVQAANPSLSHARQSPSATSPSSAAPRSPPPPSSMAPAARSPPPMSPSSGGFRPARRGSDTSSEGGFRDLGEKWYVGGKTASGEKRYLRLGMVRKERSGDRLSLDRLSL